MLKHALVMTSPYLDRPLVPLAVTLLLAVAGPQLGAQNRAKKRT
jgi:hypothetical protein